MDVAFITYASDKLADTDNGLSGAEIVRYCNDYAIKFNVEIPVAEIPFPTKLKIPNKRTALRLNLQRFNELQQFEIIKELCELPKYENSKDIDELKSRLYLRYGHLSKMKLSDSAIVQHTKHWLEDYPKSFIKYQEALSKYESRIYHRNTLDDMRLALELLVKALLNNNKSLENQINEIGEKLKLVDISNELRNMITTLISHYTRYQNNNVKHDDHVNEVEIEFMIEYTSIVMKFLIKTLGK